MYTWKGKVCYARKKRYFDWPAATRVFRSVALDAPEKAEDCRSYLRYLDTVSETIYHQFRAGERFIRGDEHLSRYAYTVFRDNARNAIRMAYFLPESVWPQIKKELRFMLTTMIRIL